MKIIVEANPNELAEFVGKLCRQREQDAENPEHAVYKERADIFGRPTNIEGSTVCRSHGYIEPDSNIHSYA